MKVLRATDRVAVPWKNGFGLTREIAIHPPGATMADFDWRISTAAVDVGGPFSIFPGVDRTLVVLDGALQLIIGATAPVRLDRTTDPCQFPGDVPVDAELRSGPVTDLNIMVRRGMFVATMKRLSSGRMIPLAGEGTSVLFVSDGVAKIDDGAGMTLLAQDAVLIEPEEERARNLSVDLRGTALLIGLRRAN